MFDVPRDPRRGRSHLEWPTALPIIRSCIANQDQKASRADRDRHSPGTAGTVVDVPTENHDSLARPTITRRSMRRQDNRFHVRLRRNFWTKLELSELRRTFPRELERWAWGPGSGTPIGWAGSRSGGGSQVKIICWQVSAGTPPGARGARAREWAQKERERERLLENAPWLPIDCVGVDATARGYGPTERKCVDDGKDENERKWAAACSTESVYGLAALNDA